MSKYVSRKLHGKREREGERKRERRGSLKQFFLIYLLYYCIKNKNISHVLKIYSQI